MKRVAILLTILIAVAPCALQAQTPAASGQDDSKKRTRTITETTSVRDQPRQASLKIEEGDRITLRNRFGSIIVTGVGGDTLEVTATEVKKGPGAYKFQLITTRSGQGKVIVTTAAIIPGTAKIDNKGVASGQGGGVGIGGAQQQPPKPAKPSQPAPSQASATQGVAQGIGTARTPRPSREEAQVTGEALRGVGEIKLEVKLPRDAHIDLIDSRRYAFITSGTPSYLTTSRNDVSVTNMETPISVFSSGDVQAAKVGGLEARTRASNVYVKDIRGPVSITTVTGTIVVRDVDADVRAVSITGPISIECAKGRIEATTTNGVITLTGIGGDLDATTTGGTITFMGEIRADGRYRLKSMTGMVRMFIQKEPPGFVSSLSSYKGQILLDFEMQTELSANTATSDLPSTQGQPVRRMVGRYGDGGARITLDSFSGSVQLGRAPAEVLKKCH